MENKTEFFEPKVGETAYFWNKLEDGYCQAKLLDVTNRFYTTMGVFAFSSSEIPPINLEEVEEELPYKGQVCWGRNGIGGIWTIGHFIKKDQDLYFLSEENDDKYFHHVKEITTKNPYEVEEDRKPQIGDMCYFWDDDKPSRMVYCGELGVIDPDEKFPYTLKDQDSYKYCSLKNPLIK